VNLIKEVTSSKCRLEILKSLSDGAKSSGEVESEVDFEASTVRRNLKVLVDDGLLVKEGREYSVPESKVFLLEPLLKAVELFEVYEGEREFGDSHDLSLIPLDMREDMDKLVGGEVVTACEGSS